MILLMELQSPISENRLKTNEFSNRRGRVMRKGNISVYGLFKERSDLERSVSELRDASFRQADISVLFPYPESTKELAHEKSTKAPEGSAAGASTGAIIGGTLGWLAGIGALTVPGVGPFIAAGPLMGLLAGLGMGGAIGGLTGALIGAGIPEYEAKRYEGRVRQGGILMSVHCDDHDWRAKAEDIMERTGARDISFTEEAAADYLKEVKPRPMVGNY